MSLFGRSKAANDLVRVELQGLRETVEALRASLDGINDRIGAIESAPRAPREDSEVLRLVELHGARIADIEATLAPLPSWRKEILLAVSEGIERTDRAERRVQAVVKSARKQLADLGIEHVGIEAEAEGLRPVDGDESEEEELRLMPDDVADPGDQPSSIPGVSLSQLRRARGF